MKIQRLKNIVIWLIMSMILVTSCTPQSKSTQKVEDSGRLKVTTSFYAMYDFALKIGGDKISLHNLVPAGTEPHDWEPSPEDIVGLEKAEVFIYNGVGMETWADKILESLENKALIVVETTEGLALIENPDLDEDLQWDPHVWLNPMLAKQQMEAIKNALAEADPLNQDYYQKNYESYAQKLDELNEEFMTAVSGFSQKDIIVAHQAFGYICDAYGLNQVPIEGLSADSEPSPAKMAEITDFARKNNVKVIFFEELVSPKVAETIANEVGAQTAVLNPLEGLVEEDIQAGKDYFSVMRENLEALKNALQ